jgi:hypothetical protein
LCVGLYPVISFIAIEEYIIPISHYYYYFHTTTTTTTTKMASPLSNAITSEQWDQVIQVCQTTPSAAKAWTTRPGLFEGIKDANVLPIHEALVAGSPYPVIEALLFAYRDSVYCKESSYQRLPLHCACRKNAMLDVVDLLLQRYPDAALTADSLGRLPRKF